MIAQNRIKCGCVMVVNIQCDLFLLLRQSPALAFRYLMKKSFHVLLSKSTSHTDKRCKCAMLNHMNNMECVPSYKYVRQSIQKQQEGKTRSILGLYTRKKFTVKPQKYLQKARNKIQHAHFVVFPESRKLHINIEVKKRTLQTTI